MKSISCQPEIIMFIRLMAAQSSRGARQGSADVLRAPQRCTSAAPETDAADPNNQDFAWGSFESQEICIAAILSCKSQY